MAISELGRLRLPLSSREENNLAFCVSDALRCRGSIDRLSQGEGSFPAFNFEREFDEAQFCLRCRQIDVGPVDRESRICDGCTSEVWGRETAKSRASEPPATSGTGELRCSTEGEAQLPERARIQNRLEELRQRDGQLVQAIQQRDEQSRAQQPEESSGPQ